jgi:hypothetical protein|tara:strand:- start:14 stop:256 length:243 start_codon:yes stop_codon:yes gene_type:complete
MSEALTYHCTYTKEFPVDEYGRLGGLYSLADVPIMEHKMLTRDGILEAKNDEAQKYKVRDVEMNFVEWVPMDNVQIGERV